MLQKVISLSMKKETEKIKVTKKTNMTWLGQETLGTVEKIIVNTGSHVDSYVAPVREGIFKRYPTLSTLLVTIGITATFLGLENMFLSVELFAQHPAVLFWLGVVILAITGRLYKKLG